MPHQVRQRNKLLLQGAVLLALFSAVCGVAYASSGTISGTQKYAWSTTGGWVNFSPTNGNVQVSSTGLTGYAWSQNDGWINLAPLNGGVHNDGTGTLSGFAWDESAGWIDFSGVTIDSGGVFHGEAIGTGNTINFNCTNCNVTTTWTGSQNPGPGSGGSGGNRGGSGPPVVPPGNPSPGGGNNNGNGNGGGNSGGGGGGYLCPELSRDLRKGDTGSDVLDLQRYLSQAVSGFPTNRITGTFGASTEAAVKRYQRDNGIASDPAGVVGVATRAFIAAHCSTPPASPPPPTYPPTPSPGPLPPPVASPYPIVETPIVGPIVAVVEQVASDVSNFISDIISGTADAIVSALTGGSSSQTTPEATSNHSSHMATAPSGAPLHVAPVVRTVANVTVAVTHTAAPPLLATGVVVSSISLVWMFASALKTLSDIPLLFANSFTSLLPFAYLRRKDRPWGTVYDSKTRRPLDPAVVTLLDASGKELKTVITDLDGRFGFLAAAGTYSISAQKSHHKFPASDIPAIDPIYPEPYTGGPIVIGGEGVIVKNIPLDPVEFDWNEYEKYRKGYFKFFSKFDRPLAYAALILTPVGAAVALVEALTRPGILTIVVLAFYVLVCILYVFGLSPRVYGTLRDKEGTPLSFATVKAYYPGSTSTTTHAVADQLGRFYLLLPKAGDFDIEVQALVGKDMYTPVYKRRFTRLRGHFNRNITLG